MFPYHLAQWLMSGEIATYSQSRQARVELFQSIRYSGNVVMLGDSLTRGGEWSEFFPELDIVNRGIEGDTTDLLLTRLNEVTIRQPQIVALMIGINDVLQGEALADMQQNYQQIIAQLVESGSIVVVQSVLYCATPRCFSNYNESITKLNTFLKQASEQQGALYLDLNQYLAPASHLQERFTYDGVHLTGVGYQVWRRALAPLLNSEEIN